MRRAGQREIWKYFILAAVTLQCNTEACLELNNRYQQGNVMRIFPHSSLILCSSQCYADPLCVSFNFFVPTLECQLNFEANEIFTTSLSVGTRSYFGFRPRTPSEFSDACNKLGCLPCEVCHRDEKTNDIVCKPRDHYVTIPPSLAQPDMKHNCYDFLAPVTQSRDGIYTLTAPEVCSLSVYCDMTTNGGGWLVIQRRLDGSVDFNRNWQEYTNGFGNVGGELWLGNENIYQITNNVQHELRIELEDLEGGKTYAHYSHFRIESKKNHYKLNIGSYSGTAGDSLAYHNGSSFSTVDADHDALSVNCAVFFNGGWWFRSCLESNLNGVYLNTDDPLWSIGVAWFKIGYSLRSSEMKIRPVASDQI